MRKGCPGAASVRGTPTLKLKACPECGNEVEIFSNDARAVCECGFIVYNDEQSCMLWCKHAKECAGDETYERFMSDRNERA